MNAITVFGFALWILGLAVTYFARFCLRHSEKLTSDELAKRYPHLGWVKWGYPVGVTVVFWSLFLVWAMIGSLYKNQLGDRLWLLGAPVLSVLSLLEGFIALSTSVYSASTRYGNWYVYDADKHLAWIAQLQIVSAIVITIVSWGSFVEMSTT